MYFETWNTKCSLHSRGIGMGKTVYVHPRKISPLNPDIYGFCISLVIPTPGTQVQNIYAASLPESQHLL